MVTRQVVSAMSVWSCEREYHGTSCNPRGLRAWQSKTKPRRNPTLDTGSMVVGFDQRNGGGFGWAKETHRDRYRSLGSDSGIGGLTHSGVAMNLGEAMSELAVRFGKNAVTLGEIRSPDDGLSEIIKAQEKLRDALRASGSRQDLAEPALDLGVAVLRFLSHCCGFVKH